MSCLRRSAGAPEETYETLTLSELHELAAPLTKLTTRAIVSAVAQLRSHHIAVSALAQMLRVAWNSVWDAIGPFIQN